MASFPLLPSLSPARCRVAASARRPSSVAECSNHRYLVRPRRLFDRRCESHPLEGQSLVSVTDGLRGYSRGPRALRGRGNFRNRKGLR
jgi:hypothetical protein